MLDLIRNVLAIVFVFGTVIAIHELGHFVAAKMFGVYAPRFSIGFGPPIFRKRFGETEYVLAWLPLGGFVRMASRDDESMAFIEGGSEEAAADAPRPKDWDENAMMPFGPKQIPPERFFEGRPLPARILILTAGVIMNMVLAYVVFAGMQVGYGRPVLPPVVDSLQAGSPAEIAGLRAGDSVVAVNGTPVAGWVDMVELIRKLPGKPVTLDVRRQGAPLSLLVHAETNVDLDSATGIRDTIGRIGVWAPHMVHQRVPLGEALTNAWRSTVLVTMGTGDVVVGLIRRTVPLTAIGGPVQIAKDSVTAARNGFEQLLVLLAILSINLAVFNLLPIPILDGGQILVMLLEKVKGTPFSLRTRENILRFGLVAILLLICLVMFNDLGMRKLFG